MQVNIVLLIIKIYYICYCFTTTVKLQRGSDMLRDINSVIGRVCFFYETTVCKQECFNSELSKFNNTIHNYKNEVRKVLSMADYEIESIVNAQVTIAKESLETYEETLKTLYDQTIPLIL